MVSVYTHSVCILIYCRYILTKPSDIYALYAAKGYSYLLRMIVMQCDAVFLKYIAFIAQTQSLFRSHNLVLAENTFLALIHVIFILPLLI